MEIIFKKINYWINNLTKPTFLLFFLIIFIFFILLFFSNIVASRTEQQFVFLADSFLKGKLFFVEQPGSWVDTTFFNNHYYWPLGPFPALILLPFVLIFHANMTQGYLQFILNIINFLLLYKIAKFITKNRQTALWLSFGYSFASAYIFVALITFSWTFAQVVTTTLLLLALYLYFARKNKNWFLIGICLGFAIATRVPLIFSLPFFSLSIWFDRALYKEKLQNTIKLFIPVIVITVLLLIYNYLRFGNIFEQGYNNQILNTSFGLELYANRQAGIWSFIHFPANLYYLFLKGPDGLFVPGTQILIFPFIKPNIWGMSILFTSPLLIWLINTPLKLKIIRLTIITTFIMLFTILGYYGIGIVQQGYRYALDFYPFLFIMLAYAVKNKIPFLLKCTIIFSSLFNLYLFHFR